MSSPDDGTENVSEDPYHTTVLDCDVSPESMSCTSGQMPDEPLQMPQQSDESLAYRTDDTADGARRPILPPCRICGGKASGFHYGVNTCEACKVRSNS